MSTNNIVRVTEIISIHKRGKRGIWSARYRRHGRSCRESLRTPNLQVAKTRALALNRKILDNESNVVKTPITIEEAIERYLTDKRRVEHRKPRTLASYTRKLKMLEETCAEHGVRLVAELTANILQALRSKYANQHDPRTIYNTCVVIKQFGNWLENWELIPKNPFRKLKFSKPKRKPKYVLTVSQVGDILDRAEDQRRVQLAMLAFTGMRVGELCHLRPQDIDIDGERGFVRIAARDDWSPKTIPERRVPIHPVLRNFLGQLRNRSGKYVFTSEVNPSNRRVAERLNPRSLLLYFQRLASAIGIPVMRKSTGVVVHSLRDFFETTCVNAGVPQFVIDIWMGHSSNNAMGRTYFGLNDDESHRHIREVPFGRPKLQDDFTLTGEQQCS